MADDRATRIINTLRSKGIDPTKTSFNDLRQYISVADIVYLNQHGVTTPGATTSSSSSTKIGGKIPSVSSLINGAGDAARNLGGVARGVANTLGASLDRASNIGDDVATQTWGVPINTGGGRIDPGGTANMSAIAKGNKSSGGFLDGLYDTINSVVGAGQQAANTASAIGSAVNSINNAQGVIPKPGVSIPNGGDTTNFDPNMGVSQYPGDFSYTPDTYTPASYTPATIEMPKLPDAPKFSFQRNDFTKDANRMTADAYSPAFEALDTATNNAQTQYKTSDAITAGLYKNLVDSILQQSDKDATRYDQAGADSAARAKATQATIGNTYDQSAAQEAALMQKFGIKGNGTISGDTSQKAYQQSAAAQTGQAQQDAFDASKQTQGDWNSNLANAEKTQGTVTREDNLRDLNNILSGIDSQRSGLSSEQALKALDLSQQLSSDDLGLQQLQYGAAQDQIQNIMQQAQMRLGVDTANVNAQNQAGQFNVGNENQAGQFNVSNRNQASSQATQNQLTAWQQQQQQQQAAAEASRNQANLDRQYNTDVIFKERQMDQDAAAVEAQRQAAEAKAGQVDPTKPGIIQQNAEQLIPLVGGDPNKAAQLMQLAGDVYANSGADPTFAQADQGTKVALFIQKLKQAAQAAGVEFPDAAIAQAALGYASAINSAAK